MVRDPAYLAALKRRLLMGTAGAMEPILWAYAYGKPTEKVDITNSDGSLRGYDLAKLGAVTLAALVQVLEEAAPAIDAVAIPLTTGDETPETIAVTESSAAPDVDAVPTVDPAVHPPDPTANGTPH